jgi:hypothetical protein
MVPSTMKYLQILIASVFILTFVSVNFSVTGRAVQNPVPPPYSGKFEKRFLEKAEFSVSAPNYEPPVTTVVWSVNNASGWLTHVRWTSHKSMGGFGTYISLMVDGVTHEFPLAYGHENQRNVGLVYSDGGAFSLPFGDGVRFRNSFEVKVYGRALMPGQVAGGGGLYNIYVGYRTDQ